MSQCPHCSALLPSTPQAFCPNCGAALPAPPPPLPPSFETPGFARAPRGPAATGTPWERRGELGFVPALVETTKEVLFNSADFYRRMPTDTGIGAPLGYAMLIGSVGIVVSALYSAVMNMTLGHTLYQFGQRAGPLGRIAPMVEGGVGFVSQIVFGPFFLLMMLFLSAGIYHLVLLMADGAKRGFEATFRVVCYGQAASVFLLVPICGQLIGAVWGLVVLIVGLSEAHGISRGKAALAVLLPLALCCCCCGATAALFMGGIAEAIRQAR